MENKESDSIIESTDLLSLSPNHRRFVNLYLSGQYSLTKISELMDVHVNTIRKWMKRDDVQKFLTEMQMEQQKLVVLQLNSMAAKATDKLGKLIDSNIDGVALQAVKDVLDRTGHKAKQEVKKEVTITTFEQQINSVMAETMQDIIDVELEENE